ncbi:MAG: hypothetical protein HQM12_19330 [SAR324 cluster bacterium]|nr:hypothetical protein [SAR324 cluster bacterium]
MSIETIKQKIDTLSAKQNLTSLERMKLSCLKHDLKGEEKNQKLALCKLKYAKTNRHTENRFMQKILMDLAHTLLEPVVRDQYKNVQHDMLFQHLTVADIQTLKSRLVVQLKPLEVQVKVQTKSSAVEGDPRQLSFEAPPSE